MTTTNSLLLGHSKNYRDGWPKYRATYSTRAMRYYMFGINWSTPQGRKSSSKITQIAGPPHNKYSVDYGHMPRRYMTIFRKCSSLINPRKDFQRCEFSEARPLDGYLRSLPMTHSEALYPHFRWQFSHPRYERLPAAS